MVEQQISHEEVLDSFEEESKSVYSILAMYLTNAQKHGLYVKGYVDGEENYQTFLKEFNALCKTKFIVRTSWRKLASNLPRKTRYGKEERIYWEYNSGNLEVPFLGTPFVVRSCLTKHCQYGRHYYKTTAEKISEQYEAHSMDPSVPLPENKKRRNKPTKKRNCPAVLHVREVVLFPDFSVDIDKIMDLKYHVRQEKAQLLLKLKDALSVHKTKGAPLRCTHRFYLNLPLPEVHIGHPHPCGGVMPILHPSVTEKIDKLLLSGIYEARHVRVIVHDYVREVLLKQDYVLPYNVVIYPSEHTIADYIYMSSITDKPTIIVENDSDTDPNVKGEVEGNVDELMGLLNNCQNTQTLAEAKEGMMKIINTVKKQILSESPPRKKKKCTKKEQVYNPNSDMSFNQHLHEPLADIVIAQISDDDVMKASEQCLADNTAVVTTTASTINEEPAGFLMAPFEPGVEKHLLDANTVLTCNDEQLHSKSFSFIPSQTSGLINLNPNTELDILHITESS